MPIGFFPAIIDLSTLDGSNGFKLDGEAQDDQRGDRGARRAQAGMRHYRILGQSHGHNFVPLDGVEPCAACHLLPVCTRSSAHLSSDDRTWCRAVFNAEPWQISQIFGLDARRTPVNTLYGQRDASLKPRGYYLLDGFDHAQLATSDESGA